MACPLCETQQNVAIFMQNKNSRPDPNSGHSNTGTIQLPEDSVSGFQMFGHLAFNWTKLCRFTSSVQRVFIFQTQFVSGFEWLF
jgi:hypothetical protein